MEDFREGAGKGWSFVLLLDLFWFGMVFVSKLVRDEKGNNDLSLDRAVSTVRNHDTMKITDTWPLEAPQATELDS